jgi:uncharacterized protein (DUF736 family)
MALKKVGSLWSQKSKEGKEYMSGSLDLGVGGEARVMVFANQKKEGKQPDYTISIATDDQADAKK